MQHCWPSSGPDNLDMSLKWPTCKIANVAQISQINYGPFLVRMWCSRSRVCVFWMWASSGLCGFSWLTYGIVMTCLWPRSGKLEPKNHHSTQYECWTKVPKSLSVGQLWGTANMLSGHGLMLEAVNK